MRALGTFNIVYGSIGLISTLLLVFVMPVNPLSRTATISGALASGYIVAVGVILRIWGDRAFRWMRALAASQMRRILRRPTAPIAEDGAPSDR